MNDVAVELTVEELHFLAAAFGLAAVPGLGPLPADPNDERALGLLAGTAARSLVGRELGAYDADGNFEITPELAPLFAPFEAPDWVVTAVRWNESERGARAWTARGDLATEVVQLSESDYALVGLEPPDVHGMVADFLDLSEDDDSEGEPEPADDERLAGLVAEPAWLAEATRVVRAGEDGVRGLSLQWIDPGGTGPVWVLGDDDPEAGPVHITRTGRRALLAQLAY